MNLNYYLKGKILVVIDAANLESSVKSLGWWIRNLIERKNKSPSFSTGS
jgi:hypothetical protein